MGDSEARPLINQVGVKLSQRETVALVKGRDCFSLRLEGLPGRRRQYYRDEVRGVEPGAQRRYKDHRQFISPMSLQCKAGGVGSPMRSLRPALMSSAYLICPFLL